MKVFDEYYKNYEEKCFFPSFVEWTNKRYFTPLFIKEFNKIVNGIKDSKNPSGIKKRNLNILECGCGSGLMSGLIQ